MRSRSRIDNNSEHLATVFLVILISLAFAPHAAAEDVIYVSNPTTLQGYMRVAGTIVDYSSKGLTVEIGGKTRTLRTEHVQRIETSRREEQLRGDALYESGQFTQALDAYKSARDKEPRPWVRREITARIVWCHRALGQPTAAAMQFLLLVRADPATPYFDCIPLAWYGSAQSSDLEYTARSWLREETMPAAVLLGASFLLPTQYGSTALSRLRELANSSDENVARLARVQAWRPAVVSATPTQLDSWQKTVEEMPPSLRAGPYYLIGQGWQRNEEWEKAALAFLRIPVLDPDHRQLATRALLDAAMSLGRLDRHEEADRLYGELIEKYPESPLVNEARRRLAAPSG